MNIIILRNTAQFLDEIQNHYKDKDKDLSQDIEKTKNALIDKFKEEIKILSKKQKKFKRKI